jgi:intein/homing endonuclease
VANPHERLYTFQELLFIVQEMLYDEGRPYFEESVHPGGAFSIYKKFVEYLLYRNLANYDSMVLVTSEKGCITGDAWIIVEENGEKCYRKLIDLVDKGPIKVLSYDMTYNDYEYQLSDGVEYVKTVPVWKLYDSKGNSIIATEDHPFLCVDWKYRQLKDLEIGEWIVTKNLFSIVEKKEFIGTRKVYDVVNVRKNHNFVCNNFVVSNTGKSSAAISMAREWCRKIGIRFDPQRHIAYSNADVMTRLDTLNSFEPLICFCKDTKISTKNGYKKIQDIIIGDEVFTHKGRIRKVKKLFKRKVFGYFRIVIGNDVLNVTGNHPIMLKNRRWVCADDLRCFDDVKKYNMQIKKFYSDLVFSTFFIPIDAEVYNFEVEDDNTYIAENVVVHNCDESIKFACLSSETKIKIFENDKIVEKTIKKLEGQKNIPILSYNKKYNWFEKAYAEKCIKTKIDYVYEIEMENGQKIKATKEHMFFCADGKYRRLDELKKGDDIVIF